MWSLKFQQGDSGLMPEWAEDTDNMEVGMFNSSGAFEIVSNVLLIVLIYRFHL